MAKTIITSSTKETMGIGEVFGKKLKDGDIVALNGDLGSGKTTFTKGLAKGLGVKDRVISPSFVIERIYKLGDGSRFYHIDLYRLESITENMEIELSEIFNNKKNIVAIEWADKISKGLPKKRINIFFKYLNQEKRSILIK